MKFCPHCGADLSAYMAVSPQVEREAGHRRTRTETGHGSLREDPYNQDETWKELNRKALESPAEPDMAKVVLDAVNEALPLFKAPPARTIVHLLFDRTVSLEGGAIFSSVVSEQDQRVTTERLKRLGYQLDDDNHVVTVDHIPVPSAYSILDYWGGASQHKRWHLTQPVTISPSRNGNPCFIDENMVAFRAIWADADRLETSLHHLVELLMEGVNGIAPAGTPVVLHLASDR